MRFSAAGGFTLVELIVASSITVLVTGSAVVILGGINRASERIERQMALQQEARSAVRAISTSLRNAVRPRDPQQVELEGIDQWTAGAPDDRIRFFTTSRRTIRPRQPESDVHEVEFRMEHPKSAKAELPVLLRRTDPTRNPQPDGGGVVERVAKNVVGFDLMYHDGLVWRQQWKPDYEGWPTAIRIRILVADPSVRNRSALLSASRIVNFPAWPAGDREEAEVQAQ